MIQDSSFPRRTFLGGTAAAALAQTANPKRPNIVYLHSHDTGRYLQPYGHAVPAPNLQKLAEEGVLFSPGNGPAIFFSAEDGRIDGRGEAILAGELRKQLTGIVVADQNRYRANFQFY